MGLLIGIFDNNPINKYDFKSEVINMNSTEEVLQSINENIKKLTHILDDIDPEIYYDHTRNLLSISVRALIKGTTSFIYGAFMDPDMADVFLTRLCDNPKQIRNRFEISKILTALGYGTHTNFNKPNVINAKAIDHVTRDQFYSIQDSYITVTELPNENVDLEIHIVNKLSRISEHKEKRELDKTLLDVNTHVLTPSEDETINIEESHKRTLRNVAISNICDEILKAKS